MQTQQFADFLNLHNAITQYESNIEYLQLILGANFEKLIITINEAEVPGNVYEANTLYLNQTIIPFNIKQEAMILIADAVNEWKRRLTTLKDYLIDNRYIIVKPGLPTISFVISIDSNGFFHYTTVKSASHRYTYFELIELLPLIKENKLSIELIN